MPGGGGGRCCGSSPGRGRGSHSASGSELPTSLSAAIGVTEQLVVDLGDTLDKVDHGAGQSCVRIVPAERLPDLREVRDIMFSWIRPVDMPSRINGGHASLRQEVDFD